MFWATGSGAPDIQEARWSSVLPFSTPSFGGYSAHSIPASGKEETAGFLVTQMIQKW